MSNKDHFSSLNNMYMAAPINTIYKPTISLAEGEAVIKMQVDEQFHHSGGSMHGSVYFKNLDDAAYFAASTLEKEFFVVTTSFTTYMTRPISQGEICAKGRVVNRNSSQYIVEAILYDEQDRELGRGNGIIVPSKMRLADVAAYAKS